MTEEIPIKILYFARLAEDLRRSEEETTIASGSTLQELLAILSSRGENWKVLQAAEIRCAVNQTITRDNLTLREGDEIAFFPPVTGG